MWLPERLRRAWGEALELNRQKEVWRTIQHARQVAFSEADADDRIRFFTEAIRRFPDVAEIQLLYATTLLECRPDDVAAEAVKAVELGPDDPVILVRAASLLLNRGRPEVARSYVEHARKLVDSNFVLEDGLANLEGHFAAIDKQYDLAEQKFRFAVEVDPEFESFVRDLARLLQVRGRSKEAVEVIDQALPRVKWKEHLERLRQKLAAKQ